MKLPRAALVLGLLPAACGVRLPPPQVCVLPEHPTLRAELLFGLSIPGNSEVPPAQFDAFVASVITPRFPAGLTILPSRGQWRDASGHEVRESSRVVEIAAADDDGTRGRLAEIRAAYRAQFHQKSVGLITVQSCADF